MQSGSVPAYATNALMNEGQGGRGPYSAGISQFLTGLFGNSGNPYQKATETYQPFVNKSEGALNPFYNSGTGAIPQYQGWLNSMKDPAAFINNLMSQYQQSPWAKFQTKQGLSGINNQASAEGLSGSTPLSQFQEQYAHDISSQDMQQWLQNVLGINTNYGAGLTDMYHTGAGSASELSNLYNRSGEYLGDAAYGKEYGRQQDRANTQQGIFKILFG
jgi:hypothetical protein